MPKKATKYKGRNRWLLPLIILLGLDAAGSDWQNFPGIISGFYNDPAIDKEDILDRSSLLAVSCQMGDIYRKKISDATTITVLQQRSGISFSYPFIIGRSSQLISVQSQIQTLSGDNQKDATAVLTTLSGHGTDNRFLWATTDGIGCFGLGIRYASNTFKSDIDIQQFPVSETVAVNEYFLDWLPSTFGYTITAPVQTEAIEIEAWGSTTVFDRQVRLYVNRYRSDNDFTFNYLNSSSKPSLNGKRQLDVPVSTRQNRISIAFISPEKIFSTTSLEIFNTEINYDTDHHLFGATDLRELGRGDFSRIGASVQTGIAFCKNEFQLGISTVNYSGEFLIKTPVLGYIGLGILPIAHWADGKLGNSQSFSQLFRWSRNLQIHQTELLFSGEYIHSNYKFNIQGKAHLEFGLISSPLDYPVKITANLFTLNGTIHQHFKKVSIIYSIQQIIPLFTRTDDSPIRFSEPVPGKKISTHGGQNHQIVLEYKLS